MKNTRLIMLLAMFAGIFPAATRAQTAALEVDRRGEDLHLAAPQLHFLTGRPLQQLHDGAAVTYRLSISLSTSLGSQAIFHREDRFVISYDLWEEKFSVVEAGPAGRSGSHLTAPDAEEWCLNAISVPLPSLPPDQTFVIKLDCRVMDNGNEEDRTTLTLANLIDVFSRKSQEAQPHWEAVSIPLRLKDWKVTKHEGR